MKNKKKQIGIILAVVIVLAIGGTYMIYNHFTEKRQMDEVVAYIDDEPVYYGEIEFMRSMNQIYYQINKMDESVEEAIVNNGKDKVEFNDEQMIHEAAIQRAVIKEAEKKNYSVSDEEITEYQRNEKKKLTEESGTEEQRKKISGLYNKMYKKLKVTEDENNKGYNYNRTKVMILSDYLMKEYVTDYINNHEVEAGFDYIGLCDSYYDKLAENMKIVIVD